jgi:hypothetical protein
VFRRTPTMNLRRLLYSKRENPVSRKKTAARDL